MISFISFHVSMQHDTFAVNVFVEVINQYGTDYCAVKLQTDEKMTIGYISRKSSVLSELGKNILQNLVSIEKKF